MKNQPQKEKLKLKKKVTISSSKLPFFDNNKRLKSQNESKAIGTSFLSKTIQSEKRQMEEINNHNQELEEEQRMNQINQKLDNYIIKSSENKKLRSTIENNSNEKEFYITIKNCLESISKKDLSGKTKEETEKYELVEKEYIMNIRQENNELKEVVDELNMKISSIKERIFRDTGELMFRKYENEKQEKRKNFDKSDSERISKENLDLKKLNSQLKVTLSTVNLENDEIYNMIVFYMKNGKNSNERLLNEFKRIYNSYNNESFLASTNSIDEINMRISELKKEILVVEEKIKVGSSAKDKRRGSIRQKSQIKI